MLIPPANCWQFVGNLLVRANTLTIIGSGCKASSWDGLKH